MGGLGMTHGRELCIAGPVAVDIVRTLRDWQVLAIPPNPEKQRDWGLRD